MNFLLVLTVDKLKKLQNFRGSRRFSLTVLSAVYTKPFHYTRDCVSSPHCNRILHPKTEFHALERIIRSLKRIVSLNSLIKTDHHVRSLIPDIQHGTTITLKLPNELTSNLSSINTNLQKNECYLHRLITTELLFLLSIHHHTRTVS